MHCNFLINLGNATAAEIEEALAEVQGGARSHQTSISLEMAVRGGRVSDVSATLEAWGAARGSPEDRASGALAAASWYGLERYAVGLGRRVGRRRPAGEGRGRGVATEAGAGVP